MIRPFLIKTRGKGLEQFISQNWPQVAGAIALIVWLIRNESALKEAKLDLAKLEAEHREIRQKLQSQDVTLARIDENLKGLKISVDRFIDGVGKRGGVKNE